MLEVITLGILGCTLVFGHALEFAITEGPNTLGQQPNLQNDFANRVSAPFAPFNANTGAQGNPWLNGYLGSNYADFLPANAPSGLPAYNGFLPINFGTAAQPALQNDDTFRKNMAETFGKQFAQHNDVHNFQNIYENTMQSNRNRESGFIPPQPNMVSHSGLVPNGSGFGVKPLPGDNLVMNNAPPINRETTPNRNQFYRPGLEAFLEEQFGRDEVNLPAQIPQQDRFTLPTLCGQRKLYQAAPETSVQDSNHAQFAEFPWMVAILTYESKFDLTYYTCGGAVIAADIILTAAHCVRNLTAPQIKVRAGEWMVRSLLEALPYQERQVERVIMHKDFNSFVLLNDIAILLLERPLVFQDNIQPICLPNTDENFDHQRCFASGWGKDKFGREGQHQGILKKIELPIIPQLACRDTFRTTVLGKHFQLHNSFICAGGEEGKDTCEGDGGSPLACPTNATMNSFKLVGLVAWGLDCGKATIPGAYVNVAKFVDWIKQQLKTV